MLIGVEVRAFMFVHGEPGVAELVREKIWKMCKENTWCIAADMKEAHGPGEVSSEFTGLVSVLMIAHEEKCKGKVGDIVAKGYSWNELIESLKNDDGFEMPNVPGSEHDSL